MRRQVPDLTGFIDQAGLFLAFLPVTNKLHFAFTPCGFGFEPLHGTGGG
jgi:hypothetical protein